MVKVKRRVGGSPSLVSCYWPAAEEKQTSKPQKRGLSADLVTSTINIPLKQTTGHASPPTYHSLIYRFMSLPRDMLCLRAIMFCVLPCSRHLKDWGLRCVFRCLNSSLSHTKHPRCLCINSAAPHGRHNTRNCTMCHLIRLGSQSKCSHAHSNGCLLLCNHLFFFPPFATHKHTHRTLPLFH